MIGSFGKKKFVVDSNKQITFQDLSRSSTLNTESVENKKKRPKTNIKNIGLDTFSITIKLRNHNVNVMNEINDWRKIKNAKKPYYFLLGRKKFGSYKYLLKQVDDSDYNVGKDGVVLGATIKLSFEECYNLKKKSKKKKKK